jgi:hypothetical protein
MVTVLPAYTITTATLHKYLVLSTSSIHISHSLSVRCKLAEAIAKSFRNIGDFSCVYFQKFSGCLLQLTNSTDPLVRASALSCLSEVVLSCKGRNFDAILNEVFHIFDP